jgi:hypothetical protein
VSAPSSDDSSLPMTSREAPEIAQHVAVAAEPGLGIARRERAAPLPGARRRQPHDGEERHVEAVAARGADRLGDERERGRQTRVQVQIVARAVGLVHGDDERDVRRADGDDLGEQLLIREADVLGEHPERDTALARFRGRGENRRGRELRVGGGGRRFGCDRLGRARSQGVTPRAHETQRAHGERAQVPPMAQRPQSLPALRFSSSVTSGA